MNVTIEKINERVSLRNYSDKKITGEHIDILIESAMRAPTAGNMMLYSIILIEDEKTKKTLSKTCDNQPFIANSSHIMVFIADYQKWYDYYNLFGVKDYCDKHNLVYEGPSEANLLLAASDSIIAAQNVVIAGEALGIGSCYIGDIMENYEIHKEVLNLPEFAFPIGMLCLGYYPENYNKIFRSRFDSKYVVFKEKYERLNEEKIRDMYKNFEKNYTPNNKFNAENMAQMHYRIKTGSDFFREMNRSVREALKNWSGKKL